MIIILLIQVEAEKQARQSARGDDVQPPGLPGVLGDLIQHYTALYSAIQSDDYQSPQAAPKSCIFRAKTALFNPYNQNFE